jgi:hypothetical protein
MKIAVIGSRELTVRDLELYLPPETTEIVSGGARGVDTSAAEYAKAHGLKLTVFLPDYDKYGKRAPLVRNVSIVDYADKVLAYWDGKSRGTAFVIDYAKKSKKPCKIILIKSLV